jgi:glycine/D-amino acid oxidase-like deaminating enzyme
MAKNTESPWQSDVTPPALPSLSEDITVDVAIIGGGISGVTAAYLLAKKGKKVVVLESDQIGGVATSRTTAFITRSLDMDTKDLISSMGEDNARNILSSHQHAIDVIERIISSEDIECEFVRTNNYLYAPEDDDFKALEEEHDSLNKLGLPSTLSHEPTPGFKNAGSLAIPDQAKFHPLKYLFGLAEAAKKEGALLYEESRVTHIDIPKQADDLYTLQTKGGIVTSQYVLSATHLPFEEHQPISLYFRKGLYKTYIMEVEIPKEMLPEGTYEDTRNPYHYFRIDPQEDHDRMIVGGEDHRADIEVSEDKNFAALEEFVKETLQDSSYTVARRWTGPIVEPVDGIAFIGPIHEGERLLYGTGYSGNGMTHGTLAAELWCDTIMGATNQYADLYRPFSVRRALLRGRDYIEELGAALKNSFKRDSKETSD